MVGQTWRGWDGSQHVMVEGRHPGDAVVEWVEESRALAAITEVLIEGTVAMMGIAVAQGIALHSSGKIRMVNFSQPEEIHGQRLQM